MILNFLLQITKLMVMIICLQISYYVRKLNFCMCNPLWLDCSNLQLSIFLVKALVYYYAITSLFKLLQLFLPISPSLPRLGVPYWQQLVLVIDGTMIPTSGFMPLCYPLSLYVGQKQWLASNEYFMVNQMGVLFLRSGFKRLLTFISLVALPQLLTCFPC